MSSLDEEVLVEGASRGTRAKRLKLEEILITMK
jgi:hypothetical protein